MSTPAQHTPVLVERCLELLAPAIDHEGAVLIDGTLGLGGHSEALLTRFEGLRVIGIDRDPKALELSSQRLERFGTRFVPVHAVYDEIGSVAKEFGDEGKVDGVLFDLGVSSMQLDDLERGFSYSQDAPLDMRMDPTRGQTAAELLATAEPRELRWILSRFGEEKFADRIARAIVAQRERDPITRSVQLAQLVKDNIPQAARRTGGNPAKRTFQALRIAVNSELDVLPQAIRRAIDALILHGRIVVESYQSLEDRIVKREFAQAATSSAPEGLPMPLPEHAPYLRLLTRGAEQANEAEREANPRSAPVRLRAAERIREGSHQ